ncbi:PREDICTED: uncharacterized protein LOC104591675 isoform X2 [Nelumbo nucifera]|uniref:Uncharacterized protein LOC104591675 isoform X2 n=1 Tax=Nelumbo nucifera TaxID=4432 RepID=A0A1U7Z6K6_NELNU|nr:PREDICTED: uncharacterized protein LOC104591675 isoform X2 [Nelumbo nucifera]
MLLGLRTKNRKGTSVQVDYFIHIQEIEPWPPSQSLRSLRSVLLQWENGDRNSGSTKPVIPSLGSGVGDGKIEFNESFRLPVTLSREVPIKSGDVESFQKNCLEFTLYEPRRDKTVKGLLLGTVMIDLAEYGIVQETICISAPMNCKRNFRNTAQPALFVKIQPFEKNCSSSLQRERLSKVVPRDKDGKDSVSVLMTEEYAEEAETASFTDDDVSSHSSLTISSSVFEASGSSPAQNKENASEAVRNGAGSQDGVSAISLEKVPERSEVRAVTTPYKHLNRSSSHSSPVDLSSEVGSPEDDHSSLTNFWQRSSEQITKVPVTDSVEASSAVKGSRKSEDNAQQSIKKDNTDGVSTRGAPSNPNLQMDGIAGLVSTTDSQINDRDYGESREQIGNGEEGASTNNGRPASHMEEKDEEQLGKNRQEKKAGEKIHSKEDKSSKISSQDAMRKQVAFGTSPIAFDSRDLGVRDNSLTVSRLKHVKSVRSPVDTSRNNELLYGNQLTEVKEVDVSEDIVSSSRSSITAESNDAQDACTVKLNCHYNVKVQQLEHRVESLERELREAAAVEVGLYSVVAEHGSSANKVHAPARRLSRLYHHACRKQSPGHRATAARSAVSGLVLVAKACGNDIPRLTFWLSNSVVLREIISQVVGESQLSICAGPQIEANGGKMGNEKKYSPLKWNESSLNKKEKFVFSNDFDEWEDPQTFVTALEKTLTPYMQSATRIGNDKVMVSNSGSLGDQEQGNFSLHLWKEAFRDACEKLCPVRAGGHECGCLPVLARLVMEQCMNRLDVALFNAILRESADEIPTDPVSDPISDSKVLPIPAGKSSFGNGAQLKNAIGNWSRCLIDLFGMDEDGSFKDENGLYDEDRQEPETSFKTFHLLNALSDLMMLPKDMILNRAIRKEVCPTLSVPLIRRVLSNFVPDEFCSDPVPEFVLETLSSEDPVEAEEESLRTFPCNAAPIVYKPPTTATIVGVVGDVESQLQLRRSGSSMLRKSYTSDDELDELDSSLVSIITDGLWARASSTRVPSWNLKENGGQKAQRYELLREVWRDGD